MTTTRTTRTATGETVQEVRPGRTLFLRREAIGEAPPLCNLVFLHGTCGASSQFDGVLDELRRKDISSSNASSLRCVCYLYDAVGCGQSPIIPDDDDDDEAAYSTDEAIEDLKALLPSKKSKGVFGSMTGNDQEFSPHDKSSVLPTIVIAHSYAPTCVVRYLHRHQSDGVGTIRGCVFLSSAIRSDKNPSPDGGHPIFAEKTLEELRSMQASLTAGFVDLAYHSDTESAVKEKAVVFNNRNDIFVARAYQRAHHWSTKEECESVRASRIPVCVVHGKDDKIVPCEAGEELADAVGASDRVWVDEASHNIMEERPREVAVAIVSFIGRLSLCP